MGSRAAALLGIVVLALAAPVCGADKGSGKDPGKGSAPTQARSAAPTPTIPSAFDFQVDDLVYAKWRGTYYLARILKVRDDEYRIHYEGHDNFSDEWAEKARLIPAPGPGQDVEARWHSRWVLGRVLEVADDGERKVHLTVMGNAFDEWKPLADLRYARPIGGLVWALEGKAWTPAKVLAIRDDGLYDVAFGHGDGTTATGTADPHDLKTLFQPGDYIQVEWQGDWYDCEILEFGNQGYKIHYVGWDSSWDEWVGPSRMRSLR